MHWYADSTNVLKKTIALYTAVSMSIFFVSIIRRVRKHLPVCKWTPGRNRKRGDEGFEIEKNNASRSSYGTQEAACYVFAEGSVFVDDLSVVTDTSPSANITYQQPIQTTIDNLCVCENIK